MHLSFFKALLIIAFFGLSILVTPIGAIAIYGGLYYVRKNINNPTFDLVIMAGILITCGFVLILPTVILYIVANVLLSMGVKKSDKISSISL